MDAVEMNAIGNSTDNFQQVVGDSSAANNSHEQDITGNEVNMNINETIDSINQSMSTSKRSQADWDCIGRFASTNEIQEICQRLEVRRGGKDSEQKTGLKIYFYCTKRYAEERCSFKMFSIQPKKGPIALYKSGQHNHPCRGESADGESSSNRNTDDAENCPAQPVTAVSEDAAPAEQQSPYVETSEPSLDLHISMYSDISDADMVDVSQSDESLLDQIDKSQNSLDESKMTVEVGTNSRRKATPRRKCKSDAITPKQLSAKWGKSWILVGEFASEDKIHEEYPRFQRVKANSQKEGQKIYHYCFNRKRSGCTFRMHSSQADENAPVLLFQSGEHNHALDDEQDENDSPKTPSTWRGTQNWDLVGKFDTDEEVQKICLELKVKMHIKSQQKENGLKVLFNCPKRTCSFQMCSLQSATNAPISLYRYGSHNHAIKTTKAQNEKTGQLADDRSRSPNVSVTHQRELVGETVSEKIDNVVASSPKQEEPQSFNIDQSLSYLFERAATPTLSESLNSTTSEVSLVAAMGTETRRRAFHDDGASAKFPSCAKRMRKQEKPMQIITKAPPSYYLWDNQNKVRLTQIAADLKMSATFNARKSGEICFTAGSDGLQKSVTVTDTGATVSVSEKFGGQQIGVEVWKKADFNQFVWALKAKCLNTLFP